MTDIHALNKRIKLLIISGWIRFGISLVCFWFVLSRSISWLTWVLLFAALIFLSLSLAASGGVTSAKKIFALVTEGEVYIPDIAKKIKSKEEHTRNNIKELIKIGVFPGASLVEDKIKLADLQQEESIPEFDNQTVLKSADEQRVDLNTASEQELADLPGIGIVLAKRTAQIRVQIGGFTSVQDFCTRLELMPHFAVQIEALAFVKPIKTKPAKTESKGRVVDI